MKALRLPRTADFTSRVRGPQVSARVGMWLGVAFAVAFLTGVFSHYAQADPAPAWLATRPVWLYRVTQGVHLLAGTAAIPLLLVKLWSVYPRLFIRPPDLRRWRAALGHLLERGSIAVLVACAIFQVVTGVVNITTWYPWSFSFRSTHYAVAWIAVGSLIVHVAVKLPVIRSALSADVDAADATANPPGEKDTVVSRRTVLRATWLAAGVAVLSTAGATIPWLRRVSVFAVRSGEGPQGIPINGSAVEAGVTASARDPGWRLELVNGVRRAVVSRAELEAMPQHDARLPIACVEGWSASGTWSGVRVPDLLARVGAPPDSRLRVFSLQEGWEEDLPPQFAADELTLLALRLGGEPLALDHGFPCRVIAPNRPGVTQTKWVRRLEVVT